MKPIVIENLNQIKSNACREQVQERIDNYAHDIIVRDSYGYVSVFSDMPNETGRGQWVASVCDYIPTWREKLASFFEKLFYYFSTPIRTIHAHRISHTCINCEKNYTRKQFEKLYEDISYPPNDMPACQGKSYAFVCECGQVLRHDFNEEFTHLLNGGIEIQQKETQNSWCACPLEEWDPEVDTEYYYLCVWVEKTKKRYPCPFFMWEHWKWWKIMPFMILHPFLFFRIRKECEKYYKKREKYLEEIY